MHKKFFSKIGVNYLLYGLATLLFQILVVNIIGTMNAELLSDYNLFVIIISFCNYVLPLPIILFLMKGLDSVPIEKHGIPLRTFLKYVCITLTLMWLGNLIGLEITTIIGNAMQTDISNPAHELINTADMWLNLVLVSLIGPIFEEYIFRKLLIDRTIKYGARVSIILSAVLFAFFHGNLNQFFYTFLMGGFFAYVYIKTGKIGYSMALHIIVNFMGSVVSIFVVNSANALTQGAYTGLDMAIVTVYVVMLVIILIVGFVSLLRYRKSKFNGSKTEIPLKHPLKTMFLNIGMAGFIGFFIFQIIFQLLG